MEEYVTGQSQDESPFASIAVMETGKMENAPKSEVLAVFQNLYTSSLYAFLNKSFPLINIGQPLKKERQAPVHLPDLAIRQTQRITSSAYAFSVTWIYFSGSCGFRTILACCNKSVAAVVQES